MLWDMRSFSLLAAAVVLSLTGPAIAQSKRKPAQPAPQPFDGTYSGTLVPAPALSSRPCATLKVEALEIVRGRLQTLVGLPAFEGAVTTEGFLSGNMLRADESKVKVEGRITPEADGLHLRAGIIDDQAGCAWTMDLKRQ
jgi:hypothetical protein